MPITNNWNHSSFNNLNRDNNLMAQTFSELEEHYGEPQRGEDGNAICGRGKKSGGVCRFEAGWGTDHVGFGACKYHDSEDRMNLPNIVQRGRVIYSGVAKNDRLKEHLVDEENRGELDNLDGEIVLLRAMLKILVEKYGERVVDDELLDILEFGTDFDTIDKQTRALVNLVDKISTSIKRKYEVLQIAGSTITRERVREYVNSIQLALGQSLRNECPHCKKLHNQRDTAIEAIRRVGEL
tara:strand:- start:1332 stop:2048 length:717 start_codon:yes stop_codon:yes gene_type:complete